MDEIFRNCFSSTVQQEETPFQYTVYRMIAGISFALKIFVRDDEEDVSLKRMKNKGPWEGLPSFHS